MGEVRKEVNNPPEDTPPTITIEPKWAKERGKKVYWCPAAKEVKASSQQQHQTRRGFIFNIVVTNKVVMGWSVDSSAFGGHLGVPPSMDGRGLNLTANHNARPWSAPKQQQLVKL
jgi:hypothetical protein